MPRLDEKPSLLSAGGGIPRIEEDEAPDKAPDIETDIEVETDAQGDPVWSDEPTLATQWVEHPGTCKPGKVQVAVFDLAMPSELNEYNKLIAGGYPAGAPHIEILNDLVHPPTNDGKMLALVRFRRIQYKRLLNKLL